MRQSRASHFLHDASSDQVAKRFIDLMAVTEEVEALQQSRPPVFAERCLPRRYGMVSKGEVSEDFRKQVLGYGLTTAEILYRRPDRQWLLQSYIWQNYDLFPKFPALRDFLAFWEKSLDGPLFSVTVAHCKLIKPAELRAVDGMFRLH
jgi:uncharacterized protein Usg